MKKRQRRLLLGALGLLVVILINAASIYLSKQKKPEVVKIAAPEIQMLLVKVSARCGHTEEQFAELPETQLRKIGQSYQGWSIEGKQGNVLILKKIEEGLCSICQNEEFFGISKGRVAVYYGRPNRPGPVKEMTALRLEQLPDQEREDLEHGIIVHDSREKLQLLEGLSSLQDG